MKILAFSDWRIQSIEQLIKYLKNMKEKPDVIAYAGDDISRFNKVPKNKIPNELKHEYLDSSVSKNYFEEIAKFSKYGLLAVAGNDDFPFVKYAIRGKKVYNVYEKHKIVGDYAFIGLEGATKPPGLLLHSEEEVWDHLIKNLDEIPKNKDIIIISHSPPYGVLDFGIRFTMGHIGSSSLKRFIESYNKRVKLVISGHAHSQGGKTLIYKNTTVINCASHDNIGESGKIAIISLNKKGTKVKWQEIPYNYGFYGSPQKLSQLTKVPLIGYSRANILSKNGIHTIRQLSELSSTHKLSEHQYFKGIFDIVINYAKAITTNKPIVTGKHPFFRDLENKNIYFFDAEYNPSKTGRFGIFLLGLMDNKGRIQQKFLDNPKNEKNLLEEFLEWMKKENPILITYSSTSADKPQLINRFKRFGLPTKILDKVFFDLYYDCINTQRKKDQYIYLPLSGTMSVNEVSQYLGYKKPKLKIENGLDVLIKYTEFLKTKNKKIKENIKKELLEYNRVDLEMSRFIFEKIKKIMENYDD